ncbi:dihydroorotate dehydrogenase electron transfer subunit [uncultured Flavonifractor sp.]|uniref:dihydroorotate dehydrogenase electron transfer subunit n=1 Tax=uncultured Flavonifractor sp. TaxID=1193534 RepID=UPI001747F189|nr:dihydroorotate dehydrogenase electron transfer subunit [uncultured Flavonifractor sp.]
MPIQKSCTVVEAVRLNAFAYSFTLEAEGMTPEGPDQFVHVKCGHSRLLRRPISICDWEENLLRIVFEVRGEGTEWLSRRKAGDRLDVLGPLGRGFRMDREGRYLLVGGGIGVPPMLGCAKWTAERSTAVLGFRSADRAMLSKDFQKSCKEIFLCSDDGSIGRHGFVDAQVRDILEKDKDFTAVLACGPKPMLKNVAAVAAGFGVPCQVSMEERMACGVGACLGCAIQMADGTMQHVCKDGPVFDAGEVDWNV